MKTTPDIVNRYCSQSNKIKESIIHLDGEYLIENHKRTLLLNLLDTLSIGAYGKKYKSNSERFCEFIIQFCGWNDAKRISLQQLSFILRKVETEEHKALKKYVSYGLSNYPMGRPVLFEYDPTLNELQDYISCKNLINNISISDFQHVNLLWKYRNFLVHEVRSKGADQLFEDVKEPHYIHYTDCTKVNGEYVLEEYWQIYYPVDFFVKLVDKALENLSGYLIENQINPFDSYNFEPLLFKI